MTAFTLACLPGELRWKNDPVDWGRDAENGLSITAGPETDWFNDPAGGQAKGNAAAALFLPPEADFSLRARVTVDFQATYDAGVLCIYGDEGCWAKLCFEYSPQNQPMVVSVVTRGVSDDCNSVVVAGNSVYLRIHRRAGAWAFHYSLDGREWRLARYFALDAGKDVQVGFLAQSPTGKGCQAAFAEIGYVPGSIKDIRSGE